MNAKTVLGFDFGTKSIGVAVGQQITASATPLLSIKAVDGIPNWEEIAKLIQEWQPDLVVVGLPLNMDGTEQEMTHRARKFANRLNAKFGVKIFTQDERLTTTDAKARLFELGGYKALTKGQVDAVSAVLIIESYFENHFGD
ncbi:Holliday junction resolvase RuvX [Shewanella oneidensis MR-1]|uniref:Putative pre-16S rRNA nuclease n=1 Tax=Shewanella oneidensis (strain ATCC 700550 / JCM 31522 / CIP 106686 / LMG 19005 / NCIMB 14063 / MR-1) TaxID=211586 RepID=YQGF_SHEON|nr:Holliday junction resolvase RuvX [Shewanella oneidensis]Q8EBZ8.1 RecName: Full=Putative pre-16S rRNA nuclease [Shewanella oneidensis MR-1]AAN56345.1 Holliday junction resolvase YqgF [Shewanella oneidensis MR-1]MDX5999235.1 Holliday junction resolvase RuvX [Shewanella oneidensis]MEE2029140.1 putative pre-16S rRNA nuclease [Shewanella oneidensis]QKG97751.1 Holliday junction resolvase RuvX [Shewanella oneidensis MR-1]